MWSFCRDLEIHLYFKIPDYLIRFIFEQRIWFVIIPFRDNGKSQSLTKFLVDHLSRPLASSLVLLCASLLHSVGLIFSAHSPHNLLFLLHCLLEIFALTSSIHKGIIFVAIRRTSVSLFKCSPLSSSPCHLMGNHANLSPETSIQLFFFSFLFQVFVIFSDCSNVANAAISWCHYYFSSYVFFSHSL